MNKRKNTIEGDITPKRVKKECSYGDKCYRKNPAHFREFSHSHLESILDKYKGDEKFPIPDQFRLQRETIIEQLQVILEKELYVPGNNLEKSNSSEESTNNNNTESKEKTKNSLSAKNIEVPGSHKTQDTNSKVVNKESSKSSAQTVKNSSSSQDIEVPGSHKTLVNKESSKSTAQMATAVKKKDDYQPIVPPTRRPEQFLSVVLPTGNMEAKHAATAPYHIFYTTIKDSKATHSQYNSITFLEILDSSLGELKCSLQINFMVEISWLLAQYYFAGYSQKKLTILYGDDSPDMRTINQKKPHVDAHYIQTPTPFGTHHTKMMLLCYEDGSLRVVISTANLYIDDWENRTQGLWFSPKCPELPPEAMPHDGDSPTMFKKSLLRYLNNYHLPALSYYVERVKRCDFSHINVFFVASVPGSHFDMDWGLTRVGSLLRQHCAIPTEESRQWPLIAQASSLGSFGKEPKIWLTGDFLHHFTKIKNQSQLLSTSPELKLIYPSLENVRQSHDNLLGGGCLPYGGDVHAKQQWLKEFFYQWKAKSTHRDRAMPHIKSYTRVSGDNKNAAFFLLTSANVSKAAWGSINKGNSALRINNYEVGVLLVPQYVIKQDFFKLGAHEDDGLILPYDLPPIRYTSDMSPWVSDYLR